ncbi:MAG: BrnT family toxin, partial [Magnetococcales bacterium]|nr:BrnT family toxin [Magnetococcales bacterium]
KHGVSLSDAARLEWDTVYAMLDCRRDYGEQRQIGYGLIGERLFNVVFVQHGETMRIISFRKANRREVLRYARQTQNTITDG